MATTYKIYNSLNCSVVTEFWDHFEVKRYRYSCRYYGGDIVEFMNENKLKMLSKYENVENILKYLKGGILNEKS